GFYFGVWFARSLMPSFRADFSVAHEHAADHRIGTDGVAAALGELQRAAHEDFMIHAGDCMRDAMSSWDAKHALSEVEGTAKDPVALAIGILRFAQDDKSCYGT